MKNLKRINWLIVAMLFAVTPVFVVNAQETSSAIGGTVVDSDGNPVTDATVVVKHEPTGAKKTMTTNAKGNYQLRGLRVGGPYTVSISKSGFGEASEGDLYIKLGETRDLDVTIVSDSVSLDSIQVVGVAQSVVFNSDNMGSGVEIDRDTLDNMPTVSRSVTDFVKIDSRINIRDFGDGIAVSGVNSRFNNFSIDGVATNDPFGLEAGGFPGLSQPFNIDTIEQLNVQLSPYDVTKSNFTGANINAVTKSGTNEFTGSLNIQYGNESFTRSNEDFTNEIYSLTLGGPIIKDKLFFFLGYEDTSRTNIPDSKTFDVSQLQEIIDISQSVWGFDAGAISPSNLNTTKKNLLVKLDWNINENHRAAIRYTTNEDNRPVVPNQFRSRENSTSLGSMWYVDNFQNDSLAINLYSDWTPNFSTEVRVSQSEFDKIPLTNQALLPQIQVGGLDYIDANGDVSNRGSVTFGTERFRQSNVLGTKENTFYFEGNYFTGNHSIKFGLDIQKHDIFNQFIFDSLGNYRFDNIEDFRNGSVAEYRLRIGSDPNVRYPATNWSWTGNGFFLQDNWMVNQNLTVQYGLRYDKPTTADKPRYNPDFEAAYGFRNDNVIDSGVLQPRIGFNYDMSDELMMQLRGGIGLFSGGAPNVWLSNSFTNTGGDLDTFRIRDGSAVFNPDGPNQQAPEGGRPTQDVDVLAPGFKLPTVIKTNIALDAELPWYGLVATAEYEHTKQKDAIFYEHLNLGEPTGVLPDGRFSYYPDPFADLGRYRADRTNRNRDFNDVLLLTNSGKGSITRATFSLAKTTEHFFAKASYTHTSSSEVSTGTSSRAISNWNNRPSANPNAQEVGVSGYQIENAFTFIFNYNNNFFGDTITNIGLLWTSSDGEPFSYVYGISRFNQDVNGDGRADNDLFYVPTADQYTLTDPSQREAFEAFLTASGLDRYRGQIAPRNAFKAPRVNLWDLKIRQELPKIGFARASLFFTIQNLGNLINSSWGNVYTGSFDGVGIAEIDSLDPNGNVVLDWNNNDVIDNLDFRQNNSQWQAQIGVRVSW